MFRPAVLGPAVLGFPVFAVIPVLGLAVLPVLRLAVLRLPPRRSGLRSRVGVAGFAGRLHGRRPSLPIPRAGGKEGSELERGLRSGPPAAGVGPGWAQGERRCGARRPGRLDDGSRHVVRPGRGRGGRDDGARGRGRDRGRSRAWRASLDPYRALGHPMKGRPDQMASHARYAQQQRRDDAGNDRTEAKRDGPSNGPFAHRFLHRKMGPRALGGTKRLPPGFKFEGTKVR